MSSNRLAFLQRIILESEIISVLSESRILTRAGLHHAVWMLANSIITEQDSDWRRMNQHTNVLCDRIDDLKKQNEMLKQQFDYLTSQQGELINKQAVEIKLLKEANSIKE